MPYVGCAIVSLMLVFGQFLFKLAATEWRNEAESGNGLLGLLSVPMVAALGLYGVATLLWVYVLRFVPLSRGYLFVLAGAILVPVLANLVFKEPLSPTYWVGFIMIVVGAYICSL